MTVTAWFLAIVYVIYIIILIGFSIYSPVVRVYMSMDSKIHIILNFLVLVVGAVLITMTIACMEDGGCGGLALVNTLILTLLLAFQIAAMLYIYATYTKIEQGYDTSELDHEPRLKPELEPELNPEPLVKQSQSLVQFFVDCEYGGQLSSLDQGQYDMAQMGVPNDSISSIIIPSSYSVTVYRDAGFQGPSATWIGPRAISCLIGVTDGDMTPDWNDQISSFKISVVSAGPSSSVPSSPPEPSPGPSSFGPSSPGPSSPPIEPKNPNGSSTSEDIIIIQKRSSTQPFATSCSKDLSDSDSEFEYDSWKYEQSDPYLAPMVRYAPSRRRKSRIYDPPSITSIATLVSS